MKDVLYCTPALDEKLVQPEWFLFPLWCVAASTKKLFHISKKSHNVEVKLCNLYQFLKRLMVL